MRASAMNAAFVKREESIIGISLGVNACAEHEWGIGKIRYMLGMDKDALGYEQHRVTQFPEECVYFESNDEQAVLVVAADYWIKPLKENTFKQNLKKRTEPLGQLGFGVESEGGFSGAWDEGGFAIKVGAKLVPFLKELYESLKEGNVAISTDGGVWGTGAGITLVIYDRLSEEEKTTAIKEHKEHNKMIEAVEKSGIEKKLREAGLGFWALSPKEKPDYLKSRFPYQFWLNPIKQIENNSGWFTLEDLEKWIEGEGPIPKEPVPELEPEKNSHFNRVTSVIKVMRDGKKVIHFGDGRRMLMGDDGTIEEL